MRAAKFVAAEGSADPPGARRTPLVLALRRQPRLEQRLQRRGRNRRGAQHRRFPRAARSRCRWVTAAIASKLTDPQTRQTARYRFYAGWGAQDADDIGQSPGPGAAQARRRAVQGRRQRDADHHATARRRSARDGGRRPGALPRRVAVRTSGTRIVIPVDAAWARHDLYIGVVAFRPGSAGDRDHAVARARPGAPAAVARSAQIEAGARGAGQDLARPARGREGQAERRGGQGGGAARRSSRCRRSTWAFSTSRATPSPDPQSFFFGRGRYDADVLDLYGKLIEKMDGNVAKQRFGGDAAKRETRSLPNKVRLVDLFSGPVALDANGEATIPLTLPDFNGTLRLMAVASTPDCVCERGCRDGGGRADRRRTGDAALHRAGRHRDDRAGRHQPVGQRRRKCA